MVMSKQQLPLSNDHTHPVVAYPTWGIFIFGCLGLVLVISTWYYLQVIAQSGSWMNVFGVVATYALLGLVIERVFHAVPIQQNWRYRLVFLFPMGVFLVQWLVLQSSYKLMLSWAWVLPVWFGSFVGGLVASTRESGIWENNFPPTDGVSEDVWLNHLKIIGKPGRAPVAKRLFDVCLALFGFVVSAPVWMSCSFLIWLEDPGPLLFIKNSVGKGGVNFHQWKFRTMERAAERNTGPVMASEGDERVLWVGRLLRKSALDELPQLVNILVGEMSFVGPRPQRTVLVREYLQQIPEYAYRHSVLPGLAGLAQVAGDYYLTPRQKLRYDRLYIQYISLGFDLKLILLAFLIAFWYRWRKDWNGRLPRGLLRLCSRERTSYL